MKNHTQRVGILVGASLMFIFSTALSQTNWHKFVGNPVLTPGYACSVVFDSAAGQYRMWYGTSDYANSTAVISYAVSADGRSWTNYDSNPVLNVGASGSFDSKWVTDPMVIHDAGGYKMYYTGYDASNWRIGLATSADGIHWSKFSGNPVLTLGTSSWESVAVSAPKVFQNDSLYFMYYSGNNGSNYQIGLATSTDGMTWTKSASNPILSAGNPGSWDGSSAITNAFVSVQGVQYLYYMGEPSGAIGLATSSDGLHWQKYSGNPVLTPGLLGNWDHVMSIGSVIFKDNYFKYWYPGSADGGGGWQIGYATSDTSSDRSIAAYWHFDESSGSIVADASPNQNNGTAIGTTIVPGILGNARHFNGNGDYIYVPYPSNGSLDFDSSESFTIEAWFKSTAGGIQEIVRRGLAPIPGYLLRLVNGHVQGQVGNRLDGTPPDAVLMITSDTTYSDGLWHNAMFVRNRPLRKLFLYVDGIPATGPLQDDFPIPLVSTVPLEIGRWGALGGVEYFNGTLDEIRISRFARTPNGRAFIVPSSPKIDFGLVKIGTSVSRQLGLTNVAYAETLHVDSITTSNQNFSVTAGSFEILPLATRFVDITYSPSAAATDTGRLSVIVGNPGIASITVDLSGRGFTLGSAPIIDGVNDVPDDQGKQVRVRWFPSVYDAPSESLLVTEYSLWRRVDDAPPAQIQSLRKQEKTEFSLGHHRYKVINGVLWDFIVVLPAVQFAEYAYVAPTLSNATAAGIRWSVFMVAAHAKSGEFFFSDPDSGYSIDNVFPPPPTGVTTRVVHGQVLLTWTPVIAPDLQDYRVYRSTSAIVAPVPQSLLGITAQSVFDDNLVQSGSTYYYLVTAVDSSGNETPQSGPTSVVVVTSVDDRGSGMPREYGLEQNFPNPFNPATTIRYALPVRSRVSLLVFNVLGQRIGTLFEGIEEGGFHSKVWSGIGASGIYFIRIEASSVADPSRAFVKVEKMIYCK